jgi:hypothetical protein
VIDGARRRARILSRLDPEVGTQAGADRLCELSAEVTETSGAAIMLMSSDVLVASLCTSDEVSALLEELQYILGEGPCLDAFAEDRPVTEPDLADPITIRWPAFSSAAVEAGAQAVFGFPLQSGTIRLGALNLYRDTHGPLNAEQHADALAMADVVAESVLAMQAQAVPGAMVHEIGDHVELRLVVHQASGMVSVQCGSTVAEALVRLRGYAFANDRLLADVAGDVVARSLRFDDPESVKEGSW